MRKEFTRVETTRYHQHPELSDFQAGQLRFLKQEVNRCQDQVYRRDSDNWDQQRLWYARENLKRYVEQLRNLGKKV